MPIRREKKRIGDMLINEHVITEEQLEQAVENADTLPDSEKPDAPASSNKMHELNGAQVSELMKIILEMRKKHPGWIAVEVQSADGSEVLIKF